MEFKKGMTFRLSEEMIEFGELYTQEKQDFEYLISEVTDDGVTVSWTDESGKDRNANYSVSELEELFEDTDFIVQQ